MSEQTIEYVDPHLLKPDPNQPREHFDEQAIMELAQTFDAQKMIHPIEVDENGTIILGERRWRAAKKRGLKQVPIRRKTGLTQKTRLERQLIDDAQRKELTAQERVWAYATAIYNINTSSNLTVKDIKIMYKNDHEFLTKSLGTSKGGQSGGNGIEGGQAELSRIIGVSQTTISGYLSFFKVGKQLQQEFMKENSELKYTHFMWISRLNDDSERKRVEQILLDDLQKSKENRVFLGKGRKLWSHILAYNKEKQGKQVEIAKKAMSKISTEGKEPESSEEFEEAAEALKKEAKKRKTKEQILEETRKKAENALTKGRGNVLSKVENLKKLGIGTTEFEKKIKRIKANIFDEPDLACEEIQQLKKDVDNAKKAEEKRLEEEKRKKREEEIRKQAEEEAKRKLLQDTEFIEEAAKLAPQIEKDKTPKADLPFDGSPQKSEQIVKEMVEELVPAIKAAFADIPPDNPHDPERNKLVLNMLLKNLQQGLVFCPVCGQRMFECSHCHISLEKMKETQKL